MTLAMTYPQHTKAILVLGLPLIASHVAQMGIGVTDALMLGWYDVGVLAAQVLAGMLFFVLFLMGSGFAWAVMPMVAEAQAAGELRQVRRVTRMAMWISILFAALSMPLFWFADPILRAMGQSDDTSQLAQDYLRIAGWGIFPALLVMVLKSYLAALERTKVVLFITLVAVVVNALVNYMLIFGNWGAPELGIRGAAIASLCVQILSFVFTAIYVVIVTPEHTIFTRFWRPDWPAMGQVYRLGWPIGLTSLAEVGLFAASSLMMGWLGTVPLAAHGIALQISSITFMIHLGLSNVATVRAGRAVGEGDTERLRHGAHVVIAMSMLFAALTVLVFLLLPKTMMGAFLSADDPDRVAVIAIGTGLLAAAALFQVADAAQVMALGLLRGVKDTQVPMIIAALSYWVVGVPMSYLLGFTFGFGGVGVWLGLAIGLMLAGAFMMLRFWRISLPKLTTENRL